MFLGQYVLPVDEKGRFKLPEKLQEALSEGAIIAQGFERNLVVFPKNAFQEMYQQVTSLNITNPLSRLLLRLTLGTAIDLELDKQNRLSIPKNLCEFAEIDNELVLVGQGNYFEIWAQNTWEIQKVRLLDADENAHRFASLSLSQC